MESVGFEERKCRERKEHLDYRYVDWCRRFKNEDQEADSFL